MKTGQAWVFDFKIIAFFKRKYRFSHIMDFNYFHKNLLNLCSFIEYFINMNLHLIVFTNNHFNLIKYL